MKNKLLFIKNLYTKYKKLLIVLICIAITFIVSLIIYNSTINISDLNSDKLNFSLENMDNTVEKVNIFDVLSYDSQNNPDSITVTLPIDYFYSKILNLSDINESLSKNNNISINRIGLLSNPIDNKTIDFYLDVNVRNLKAYISGSVYYEFIDNCVNIYCKNIVVGDGLPKIFYSNSIPFKENDLIYSCDLNNTKYFKNGLITLDSIKDVIITHDKFTFKYDYLSNIDKLLSFFFDKNDNDSNAAKSFMPIILEILIGDNADQYTDIKNVLLPTIQQIINKLA